jgi:hypothetical protein
MGVSYTSVASPPPTVVLNALRDSAQRIREQVQQQEQMQQQVSASNSQLHDPAAQVYSLAS